MNPEEENEKYNLPCPHNPAVLCIQIPDDSCGCDWCEDCQVKHMIYDPKIKYTIEELRKLAPLNLSKLFNSARVIINEVQGVRLIKKVTKDMASMRQMMMGFDGAYNRMCND